MTNQNLQLFAAAVLLAALSTAVGPRHAAAQGAPNVIVIISDDAGYADFGFMDGLSGETSEVPTPNLDSLAARGVTFSSAYTAMVCSPSRAAITTGGYQQRVGYEYNINNLTDANGPFEGLPVEATTIWERMQSVGYTTGAVGKWHIGSIADTSATQPGNRPERQGVDEFYGMWRGSRTYSVGSESNITRQIRETITDDMGNVTDTVVESDHAGEYITNLFGDFAVDFIADHHDDAEPFFLYQAFTAPHGPLHDSPDINDPGIAGLSGNRQRYASAMVTMDKEIGRILDSVEDPNGDGDTSDSIADDTMIIFLNDNGGEDSIAADNGNLRNYKGTPYEGGMRVPMIIAGAGVDAAAEGSVYDKPVHSVDILPTAFAAGGGSLGAGDTGIDGVNLLPYINGQNTDNPHEVIVVRSSDEVGLRKGDWKLVKTGINSGYELYNLASDIGESSNVASSNSAVVEEMQRDLTDYEVEFDKPRFAALDNSQSTVNIFDHFTFRPDQGGEAPGDNVLLNSSFEDGTQLDSDPYYTYEELASWSNNGDNTSPAQDEVAARNDNAFGGSYRGMLSGERTPYQVTDHEITLGEQFAVNLAHTGQFSGWDVGADSFDMELFYLDGGGSVVVLDTINVVPSGSWTTSSHTFDEITDPSAAGRFVGIRFDSNGGNSEFAGLDEISLGLVTDTPQLQLNWSTGNAWYEGGTTTAETMFHMDAFAGAVLEFPVSQDFSYKSVNDMTRSTGLEFMMNKLMLSGTFAGVDDQTATIEGNAILLTDSLDGEAPQILNEAYNRDGGEYGYRIDLDLVLYDDLTIAGSGSVEVIINGQIRDYFESRGVTKTGISAVALAGTNTYSGATTIAGGVLALTGSATIANTPLIEVQADGTFDLTGLDAGVFSLAAGQTLGGSGQVVGDVMSTAGASVAPGSSFGDLTITGDYTHAVGATLEIELGPGVVPGADYDQLTVGGQLDLAGGELLVVLDAGFSPGLGAEFQVLDFVSLTGSFDDLTLPALAYGLEWNTDALLTSGVLAVESGLAGDYNGDGVVDAADYTLWRDNLGAPAGTLPNDVDGGEIGIAQYETWRANFGEAVGAGSGSPVTVPEPTAALLLVPFAAAGLLKR